MLPTGPAQSFSIHSCNSTATQQASQQAVLGTQFPSTLPGFDYSLDVLDGFEQYMDATPNVPAASFAVQGFTSAPSTEADTGVSVETELQHLTSSQRRMHKNKLAQKRFRDRAKASRLATSAACRSGSQLSGLTELVVSGKIADARG